MLTFKDFLRSRRITCEFAAGILRDSRDDGSFPDGATWSAICDYLENRSCATPCALEAAHNLWLDYRKIVTSTLSRESLVAANARLKEKIAQLQAQLAKKSTGRNAGACAARSSLNPEEKHGALVTAFLKYKIVEFLQPHPGYKHDDGFQPRSIIGGAIESDSTAQDILAGAAGDPLADVLAGLIKTGAVIETPFESANGDVMLGLPENLGKRKAALEERRSLVVESAAQLGLRAVWNQDGTGSIETRSGIVTEAAGSVWDLLSYLNTAAVSAHEVPRMLN